MSTVSHSIIWCPLYHTLSPLSCDRVPVPRRWWQPGIVRIQINNTSLWLVSCHNTGLWLADHWWQIKSLKIQRYKTDHTPRPSHATSGFYRQKDSWVESRVRGNQLSENMSVLKGEKELIWHQPKEIQLFYSIILNLSKERALVQICKSLPAEVYSKSFFCFDTDLSFTQVYCEKLKVR